MIILWLVCDNVVSTVRFSLLKLVKFSFLFFSYLLLVFITPVNKDYHYFVVLKECILYATLLEVIGLLMQYSVSLSLHIRWNDVIICGHITISMLWGNTAYCVKLSGEGLWRYSNKIETVGLRKCPYYYLLRKWCYNNKYFAKLAPHHGGKIVGIDVV